MDTRTNTSAFDWLHDVEDRIPSASGGMAGVDSDEQQTSSATTRGLPEKEALSQTMSMPTSILANWNEIAEADFTVSLYMHLVRLAKKPAGWRGPGSLPLQSSSVRKFLAFWKEVRDDAVEPEVALAPDGTLHAEWYRSDRQRLDIRFADSKLFFGLFDRGRVIEGADDLLISALILKSHQSKPLRWGSA